MTNKVGPRGRKPHLKDAGIQKRTFVKYKSAIQRFFQCLDVCDYACLASLDDLGDCGTEYINHVSQDDPPFGLGW